MRKSKAQSTAEYAILLGLVIAAAAAMQIYVKRTLQARMRRAVQYLASETTDTGIGMAGTTQYEPYYLRSNFAVTRDSTAQQNLYTGGVYNAYEATTTSRTGEQQYLAPEDE
ncbi:MAG: hypothetical protein ACOY3D_03830 [Candidatus Omnitrophota bacterium]